jgi:pyruvate/2-oxoglutarate dehydrogenase complex dihydrolipoamide dehydrogenase (E3) component
MTLDASHILVTTARTANIEDLNLEAGRIRRSKSDPGSLSLNQSLRTSNPRVYAVGEAAGHAPAPHLNALEADLVVRAALLNQPSRYEPAAVPRLTLTDPPIAEVGLTEAVARGRFKTGFSVLRASFAENDRARAERNGMGVVKLIVSRSGKILGAGIVGADAGELAAVFTMAIANKLDVARLAEFTAPHPSYADLIRGLGDQAFADSAQAHNLARRLRFNRLLP